MRVAIICVAVLLAAIAGLLVLQLVQYSRKEAAHDWVDANNGFIPSGAVVGGYEAGPGREALFICRAPVNGGIYPGKVRQAFGSCRIAFDGAAMGVPTYQVLMMANASWVAGQDGALPTNAYEAGKEFPPSDEKLYVCRALYRGGIHPGRITTTSQHCDIEWGGKEIMGTSYEILLSK